MKIDVSNCDIINSKSITIHDCILADFRFDRNGKHLHLELSREEGEQKVKRVYVDFFGVIGFEMTSCDYWGSSPYILDFESIEKGCMNIIPKLFDRKNQNDWPECSLSDQNDYFETVITFVSGDRLSVACKEIAMG